MSRQSMLHAARDALADKRATSTASPIRDGEAKGPLVVVAAEELIQMIDRLSNDHRVEINGLRNA